MTVSTMLVLPEIDVSRCSGCGDCVRACPGQVLAISGNRISLARPDACDYCGRCEAVCTRGAIACPFVVVLAGAATGRA